MSCINCNTEFEGGFCPTCGEKKNVDRITFQSITTSVFSGLLDMDKGLLFNLKNLTLYPKTTILQYINGKRRNILNPISYAIITISIYLFVDSLLPRGIRSQVDKPATDIFGADIDEARKISVEVGHFLRSKMKFMWLSFAIYSALFTKLFFRKYNYFEHLAISAFILGHATILAILSRLVYNRELLIFNFLVYIYMSILIYKVFKNPKDVFGSRILAGLVVFLSFLFFIGSSFIYVIFVQ